MQEGQYADGNMHGIGKTTYATGSVYERASTRTARSTYTFATGDVAVGCYEAGADVGQGVKWSADRATAWEVQAGKAGRSIPLDEAAKIAERIGLPPP